MTSESFSTTEIGQFEERGISAEEARRQIILFRNPPGFTPLDRPCTPGDGIRVLTGREKEEALGAFREAQETNRLQKMVPASGAATRMFQSLLSCCCDEHELTREECEGRAAAGEEAAVDLIRFMDGLPRFAFHRALTETMAAAGKDLEAAKRRFDYRALLESLFSETGLGFASLPKGLVPFHSYAGTNRTPFEEHLVEGALYARNGNGVCPIHFTVAGSYLPRFERLLESARPHLEKEYAVRFDIGFSEQKRSTDTLAVDRENCLFRNEDGSPLFRPGGHGALIENLNDLKGDIVLIKNIDNVSPAQLTDHLAVWKRYLAGHLALVQKKLFQHVGELENANGGEGAVAAAREFAAAELNIDSRSAADGPEGDGEKTFLLKRFQRPIRVCGMVINEGAPGGGPFWVKSADGSITPQIVETAQVDRGSPEQLALLKSSTHFNPVDLVCGVRNHRGEPYDLARFIDESAVFISEKSKGGRPLKALERPGLWNGAMAHWNTIFVEVPAETFSPVKKVVDLLDDVHQG